MSGNWLHLSHQTSLSTAVIIFRTKYQLLTDTLISWNRRPQWCPIRLWKSSSVWV